MTNIFLRLLCLYVAQISPRYTGLPKLPEEDDSFVEKPEDHPNRHRMDGSDNNMVTITAKFWYVSDFEENDAEGLANRYVDGMNLALARSKIPIKYKRWGQVEKLPITHGEFETGVQTWDRHDNFLNAFGDNEEGRKRLKETADHMVVMANGMNKPWACVTYSPRTDTKYTDSYYTVSVTFNATSLFVHEAGHCLGAMHDRYTTNTVDQEDDRYDHGYCLPNSSYATVMAYEYNCPPPKRETILYYSNPDVSIDGIPTGDERNNNARVIKERREWNSLVGSNCELKDENGNTQNLCRTTEWTDWTGWTDCCCYKQDFINQCPVACSASGCSYTWIQQKRTRTRECLNGLDEPTVPTHCGVNVQGREDETQRCQCKELVDPTTTAINEATTEKQTTEEGMKTTDGNEKTSTATKEEIPTTSKEEASSSTASTTNQNSEESILPTTISLSSSTDASTCCNRKKVGVHTYTLTDVKDVSEYGCKDNCVYSLVNDSDSRFCFSVAGEDLQPATCVESGDGRGNLE